METIKHLTNEGWKDLYGYKMNIGDNLAYLDIEKAINNLKLDDRFIRKDVAKLGKDPSSISPLMINQTTYARFVSDNQIRFWNSKLNVPKTGRANFRGNGQTVEVTHDVKNMNEQKVAPYFCTFQLIENPLGCLGETWCTWDENRIVFGNTGSYTGPFTWIAFY